MKLNMYRELGVWIGFLLCEACAKFIFDESRKNPYKETPLHDDIECNLIAGYHKHLNSFNA